MFWEILSKFFMFLGEQGIISHYFPLFQDKKKSYKHIDQRFVLRSVSDKMSLNWFINLLIYQMFKANFDDWILNLLIL